ncbi:hypothetical protein EZS27_011065 [termite gut metagenome]|uniref:Uncharacterized protein n=1 Tax=termite gut metagenome TaxID=433724 RepID=A0A5J4S728_9ZZZZ
MNGERGYKRFAWKIDEDKDYMPERSCDTIAECKGEALEWIRTTFLSKEGAPTSIFIAEIAEVDVKLCIMSAIEDILARIDDELACESDELYGDKQWIDTINEKDKETFILRVTCLFEEWAKETGNYPKGIYKKVREKKYRLY